MVLPSTAEWLIYLEAKFPQNQIEHLILKKTLNNRIEKTGRSYEYDYDVCMCMFLCVRPVRNAKNERKSIIKQKTKQLISGAIVANNIGALNKKNKSVRYSQVWKVIFFVNMRLASESTDLFTEPINGRMWSVVRNIIIGQNWQTMLLFRFWADGIQQLSLFLIARRIRKKDKITVILCDRAPLRPHVMAYWKRVFAILYDLNEPKISLINETKFRIFH